MADARKGGETRRNYNLLVAEGILFTVGLVFFDPNTILPLLMERLTASAILIGVVGAVEPFAKGLIPLLAGNWVNSLPYKKRFLVTAMSVGRLPLWILGLSLIWITPANPLYWAALLLAVQLLFWIGDSAGDPAWMDMVGKSVPDDRRGRFFATRQVVGGLISVLGGALVARILGWDQLAFPANYGVIVTIGALLYTANVGTFVGLIERKGNTAPRLPVRQLLPALPDYLRRSPAFALTMLVFLCVNLARLSLPFYIVFGRHVFGIGEAALGLLIPLQIAGRILGAAAWGWLGDRHGHHWAIRGVAAACMVPPVLALVMAVFNTWIPHMVFFSLLFFALGFFLEGWSPFINYMLAVVPERQRTLYAGLMGVGNVPVALAPILGGLLLQQLGYPLLFIVTVVLTGSGLLFALRLPEAAPPRASE